MAAEQCQMKNVDPGAQAVHVKTDTIIYNNYYL